MASKIFNRFDTSHLFWDKISVQRPFLHKCLEYFSLESIDNPCYLRMACNPKEYFAMFENSEITKKHKGIKKGSSGMNFENYASMTVSLTSFDYFRKARAN